VVEFAGNASNTWSELEDSASRIAHHLISSGVRPGDRVLVHQSNTLAYIQTILAVAWCGAAVVPALSILSQDELDYVIAEIQPTKIIDPVQDVTNMLFADRCDPVDGTGESISQILFTSGSSGRPKGVVHQYASTAAAMAGWLSVSAISNGDVALVSTPISHASGRLFEAVLLAGATVVMSSTSRSNAILGAIQQSRTTHMIVVPTVLADLVNDDDFVNYDLSSLRFLLYASAPASPTLITRAQELFGPIIHTVYGSTEAPTPITHLDPADHVRATTTNPELLLSCGSEFEWGCQIDILNELGEPVADDQLGQLAIWSPALAQTYWQQPDLWNQRLAGDWFLTGDIARRREGFIFLADRKDDMIITGGFNVFPTEVENHIAANELVHEVAVVGIPDARWGEAVVAVVSGDSNLTDSHILEWCQSALSRHKIPKRVLIVDELPKTGHGKVSRRVVRDHFFAGAGAINGAG
jgi:acyl-CoA synthetase (AMP-forming)/AMP-acid ligase II